MASMPQRSQNKSRGRQKLPPLQGPSLPPNLRRRRRRGRRSFRRQVSRQAKTLAFDAPAARSTVRSQEFMRQDRGVAHKEWGEGTRYVGTSIIGYFATSTLNYKIYVSKVDQYDTFTYYDLMAVYDGGRDIVFSLHPAFIPRLNVQNWCFSRYAYRKMRIYSEAVSSTTNSDGYTVSLSHDVSWPFRTDMTSAIVSADIAAVAPSATGSYWKNFDLTAGDYKGDRTWSTSAPTADVELHDPGSTTYATSAQEYYQYIFAARNAGTTASATNGFLGWIYCDYVIDFYSPITIADSFLGGINFSTATLKSTTTVGTTSSKPEESKVVKDPEPKRLNYLEAVRRNKSRTVPVSRSSLDESLGLLRLGRRPHETKRSASSERKERIPPPPRLVRQSGGIVDDPDVCSICKQPLDSGDALHGSHESCWAEEQPKIAGRDV